MITIEGAIRKVGHRFRIISQQGELEVSRRGARQIWGALDREFRPWAQIPGGCNPLTDEELQTLRELEHRQWPDIDHY